MTTETSTRTSAATQRPDTYTRDSLPEYTSGAGSKITTPRMVLDKV